MNKKIKAIGKRIVYPAMDVLDVIIPPLSTAIVRRFYRYRALNDLHIKPEEAYDPLGSYVTMYRQRPGFYEKFDRTYTFDQNHVPLYCYEGTQSYEIVQVAQYGLMEYGYFLDTNEERHRVRCLSCADRLVAEQDERGGWPCEFDYPCHEVSCTLKKGWYTAMGQGQGISLLVRAWHLTGDERYKETADRALSVLEVPVSEGGLLVKLGNLDFYEEYPTTPPSYTLNGLIFCMMGLYDAGKIWEHKQASEMFRKMVETVKTTLPLYDDDHISSYDLSHITNAPRKKLTDRKYHILHVKLLQALNSVCHEEVFDFYIDKWGKHWR